MEEFNKDGLERVAKVIGKFGDYSRREAERLIMQHRVKVNGILIDTPATFVSNKDVISIDNKEIAKTLTTKLYSYYKPSGLVCSSNDEKFRETIFDYLPKDIGRLIYIGRLDLASEGLLMLTNNGELANILSSPKLALKRIYKVRAFGNVEQKQLDELTLGITINGVFYNSVIANLLRRTANNIWIEFVLTEGKNREIRHICEYLGLKVNRLIRTSFGPYMLGDLKEGELAEANHGLLRNILSKQDFTKFGFDQRSKRNSQTKKSNINALTHD